MIKSKPKNKEYKKFLKNKKKHRYCQLKKLWRIYHGNEFETNRIFCTVLDWQSKDKVMGENIYEKFF